MENENGVTPGLTTQVQMEEKEPALKESTTPLRLSLKGQHIDRACQDLDIDALIALAASAGGLLDDRLRKSAWPLLLGCDGADDNSDWKSLPVHKDEEQVALDVNRSFVYYPNDPNAQMNILKEQLSNLIISTLRTHPTLSYFQGYHDIAQVLLLVLGPVASRPALARLSLLRIRDFMLPTLSGAVSQLYLLPAILRAADPPLAKYLPPNPFWALSAILTLYAHDVQTYAHIARLFDFLLTAPATSPLYFFAAVVKSRREDLLEIDPYDQDVLHVTLTRLPSHRMNFDALIIDALEIMRAHPPSSLGRRWRSISIASALRTAPDPEEVRAQSLADGEKWLGYQSREAARQAQIQAIFRVTKRTMWRYRKPALAVAVAIFAIWLSNGNTFGMKRLSAGSSLSNMWKSMIQKLD